MKKLDEIEDRAALWIAREDANALLDRAELESWLAQDVAHHVAYLRLRNVWSTADSLAALHGVSARKVRCSFNKPRVLYMGVAAALVVAMSFAVSLFSAVQSAKDTYQTVVGQQKSIKLADGSKIQLDTDTRIKTRVKGNARSVTLDKGQAFFEVVHDGKHPFIVIAGNRRITDLGTKFSVQRNGDDVEVIVQEGKVRVDELRGSQRLPVFADRGKIVVAKADETLVAAPGEREITDALDWRFGVLVFNKEPLADVAAEFNRYNDRKIVVVGRAGDIRIGGSFRANNIDVFAKLAEQGFGLTVTNNKDEIIISN